MKGKHKIPSLMLSSKVAKRPFLKICSQRIHVLTNMKMANSDFLRLFYKDKSVDLAKESFDHPLWIQIPPYSDDIDSFRSIRNDCKMLSQLFESVDASAHDEQDFKAIEDTVNGVIQGAFTLIGIHEQEHKITAKVREYEAEAQKRKKAYEEGPGAASAIAGGWTIKAAERILDTCGGISGYYALPYGDKKAIRTKIESAIKDPDGRNVQSPMGWIFSGSPAVS
jgi:hypothetical protein